MSGYIEVNKEEFENFKLTYQLKHNVTLKSDITGICEPPLLTLNDFSNGKVYPESIVAKAYLMDGSDYYGGETTQYYILNEEDVS